MRTFFLYNDGRLQTSAACDLSLVKWANAVFHLDESELSYFTYGYYEVDPAEDCCINVFFYTPESIETIQGYAGGLIEPLFQHIKIDYPDKKAKIYNAFTDKKSIYFKYSNFEFICSVKPIKDSPE